MYKRKRLRNCSLALTRYSAKRKKSFATPSYSFCSQLFTKKPGDNAVFLDYKGLRIQTAKINYD